MYRDQWLDGKVKEGKEVADLLVVFENHIIIFSDKDCVYPHSDDQEVNWRLTNRERVSARSREADGDALRLSAIRGNARFRNPLWTAGGKAL